MTRTRRFFAPLLALLVATAAVTAAVRAWRRHQQVAPEPAAPVSDEGTASGAARGLVAAARSSGAGEVTAALAARRVVGAFAATLPARTRQRLTSHLPPDVAAWLTTADAVVATTGTANELYAHVVSADVIPPTHVPWVVDAVLGELARLVPDDADEVSRELPTELGHLWSDALVRAVSGSAAG